MSFSVTQTIQKWKLTLLYFSDLHHWGSNRGKCVLGSLETFNLYVPGWCVLLSDSGPWRWHEKCVCVWSTPVFLANILVSIALVSSTKPIRFFQFINLTCTCSQNRTFKKQSHHQVKFSVWMHVNPSYIWLLLPHLLHCVSKKRTRRRAAMDMGLSGCGGQACGESDKDVNLKIVD